MSGVVQIFEKKYYTSELYQNDPTNHFIELALDRKVKKFQNISNINKKIFKSN